jgi:nitroreductase
MFKEVIRKYFPIVLVLALAREFFIDYIRYVRESGVIDVYRRNPKLKGRIIADYHAIEKGLTMPDMRFGFGADKIVHLVDDILVYLKKYVGDEQVYQAIRVLKEYIEIHKKNNFELKKEILNSIKKLDAVKVDVGETEQYTFTKESFFKDVDKQFPIFTHSRHTIRNYSSDDISIGLLHEAVSIAQSAPSACNRQATRVYIYQDKEKIAQILELQRANRGFGHLTNKLIVLTADIGYSHGLYERNQVFVDGGMFAMNLLNALHYLKIGTCALNAYFSHSKAKKIKNIGSIPNSQNLLMIISCGIPPNEFKVARSYRYSTDKIVTID